MIRSLPTHQDGNAHSADDSLVRFKLSELNIINILYAD